MYAVASGDRKRVRSAIDRTDVECINDTNEYNLETALLMACSDNNPEVPLELLTEDDIDVNHQGRDGDTTLIRACYKGLTEMALELLKVDGIEVNIWDTGMRTALIWACYKGLTEVALELLKVDGLGFNIQEKDGYTALMSACFNGRADIGLALLRDPRVDRHIKNRNGRNALTIARDKSLTAVVTLIEALDRGDERMPLVKVHHRYLHGDVAAEGAQAQAPHPPESAITKALVDKNLVHYMSRFLAP